jgi:hypothetical protein
MAGGKGRGVAVGAAGIVVDAVGKPLSLHAGATIRSSTTPPRLTIDQEPGDEGSVIASRPR